MGMLILLFLLGAIPLGFLYLLFFKPKALMGIIASILSFIFVLCVGGGVLFGLFYWLAQANAS